MPSASRCCRPASIARKYALAVKAAIEGARIFGIGCRGCVNRILRRLGRTHTTPEVEQFGVEAETRRSWRRRQPRATSPGATAWHPPAWRRQRQRPLARPQHAGSGLCATASATRDCNCTSPKVDSQPVRQANDSPAVHGWAAGSKDGFPLVAAGFARGASAQPVSATSTASVNALLNVRFMSVQLQDQAVSVYAPTRRITSGQGCGSFCRCSCIRPRHLPNQQAFVFRMSNFIGGAASPSWARCRLTASGRCPWPR